MGGAVTSAVAAPLSYQEEDMEDQLLKDLRSVADDQSARLCEVARIIGRTEAEIDLGREISIQKLTAELGDAIRIG